jgi:hypothetical protein
MLSAVPPGSAHPEGWEGKLINKRRKGVSLIRGKFIRIYTSTEVESGLRRYNPKKS